MSAYNIFRHAVGLALCFSAALWVYLIFGDANIFLLLSGLIFGAVFAGINYFLMFFWSDFDRVSGYIFGSKSISVQNISHLKALLIFVAAFSFYTLVLFSFFQPHGVFLIFPFLTHLTLGIAPVFSIYLFRVRKNYLPIYSAPPSPHLFFMSLFFLRNNSLRSIFNISILFMIAIFITVFSYYGFTYEYNLQNKDIIANYLIILFFILALCACIVLAGLGILSSYEDQRTKERTE